MSAVYNSTVQGFYLSYYGRPADPEGLTFWTGQLAAAGGNLSSILNAFGTSAEATRRYGTGTTESKIQAVYQQTFGRAADATGLAFYTAEITAGRITLIDMSKRIIDGATGDDVAIRNNRTSAAQSFTDKLDTDAEKAGYSGSGAEDAARAWVATVTKDAATVTAAVATADATITALLPASFALTTSADTFTGGAGNDAFSGVISALSTAGTLNATDKLDGGAGTDTISLTQAVNFDGFTSGFLKNVEVVKLTNSSTSALSFSATGTSGVTEYALTGTSGAMTLSNVATGLTTLTVNGMKSSSTTVALTTSFVSGAAEETATSDAVQVNLNGVGNAQIASSSTDRYLDLRLNSFDTVNLVSTGDNFVGLTTATSVKKVNASGAGALTVGAVNAEVTDFDASAMTAAVTATLRPTGMTGLKTVKTGTGNDSVTVEVGKLTGNATLSGGAGTDTLTLRSAAGGTAEYVMSGFETLALNAMTGGVVTLALGKTSDLTKVTSRSTTETAVTLTGSTGDLTFDATGTVSADGNSVATTVQAGAITSDHSGATTLNYVAASKSITDKVAQQPLADYVFSKTTGLTVNVGEFIDASGSTITADRATSVTVNTVSSKDSASSELGKFTGQILAPLATSITVNNQSDMTGADIQAVKATSVSITNGDTANSSSAATGVTLNVPRATSLTLSSNSSANYLAAGDFDKVQSLTVTAGKGTTTIRDDLPAAATLVLSGSNTTSSGASTMTFVGSNTGADRTGGIGKVGASGTGNMYDLSVTATGLKGGLNFDDLQTGDGYSISLDTSGVTGPVVITDSLGGRTAGTESTLNITVNSKGMGGTGSLNLGAGNSVAATGNVTINAADTAGATVGNITARNINVDVSGTTAVSSVGTTIGVGGDLTLKLHALAATATYNVTPNASTTAMTFDLTGGVNADNFNVNASGVSGMASATFRGDLGAGSDTVTFLGQAGTATTVSLANLAGYNTGYITTGSGNDTITGGAGADVIAAGTGTNTLTGGTGADTFVFRIGTDSKFDAFNTITDFNKTQGDFISASGATQLSLITAGTYTVSTTTVTVTSNGAISFAGTATNFDTLIEISQILSNAAVTGAGATVGRSGFFTLSGDTAATYLFASDGSNDGNGNNDVIIRLVGVGLPTSSDSVAVSGSGASSGLSGFGA